MERNKIILIDYKGDQIEEWEITREEYMRRLLREPRKGFTFYVDCYTYDCGPMLHKEGDKRNLYFQVKRKYDKWRNSLPVRREDGH